MTATESTDSMALPVTRHAQITNLEGWKVLACGVDTLDLGLYVQWSDAWETQAAELDEGKAQATGTSGLLVNGGAFLILPGGKAPNYRWHLQWPGFHLYLGRSQEPQRNTPNVYASINSQTLWQSSIEEAVSLVVTAIESLAGRVLKGKPSRCDLAADFFLPNGLTLDLLLALRVPFDLQHSHNMTGDRLETFYQGAKSSPVQLRIYDKALEVLRGGTKLWFLDIWKLPACENVWRVEFQIRRPFLKSHGIDTVPGLVACLGGLWTHLTQNWFSLRLLDDSNSSRRTVHPWWFDVQRCDALFGQPRPLERSQEETPADADWYVAHCAGCLASYAARRRFDNFDLAAQQLTREMKVYWSRKDFAEQYAVKSIQLGFAGSSADDSVSSPFGGEAA